MPVGQKISGALSVLSGSSIRMSRSLARSRCSTISGTSTQRIPKPGIDTSTALPEDGRPNGNNLNRVN